MLQLSGMANRLENEKSPYLKQHAHNPVDWYPWGDEAFERAQKENKIVFLSIGYSTCYWCHVMEKECFERDEVGAALNADFISVKVDREEHPEVDEIYMDAVMAMNGQGGWPMSVFLTPDRKPFWGGTYIPRPQFLQLLGQVNKAWKEAPDQIKNGGEKLRNAIEDEAPKAASDTVAQAELFNRFCWQADSRFDAVEGGFSGAPKFPSSQTIRLLMRIFKTQRNPKLMEMAVRTLDRMACGGIYDQLGGGFHRYSVDEKWLVPHFEKMLYDNALLVPAYLEGFQLTAKKMYANVARETLDYLFFDMRSPEGGFYSAEDAGDVGKEGEFYVWKEAELRSALGASFEPFAGVYPVTAEGNFEHGTNVLHLRSHTDWEASRALKNEREILLAERKKRVRPHRDTKILTGWNGLTITAFAKGYSLLGTERYLKAAESCAEFLKKELFKEGRLLRRYCDGESRYNATASDYAYLIEGLLALYQAGFNPKWLLWARELQKRFDEEFWTEKGYTTAAKSETGLITRKIDRHDGATPSPNSVAMGNLLRLSQYFLDPSLDDRASDLFAAHGEIPEKFPMGLPALLLGAHMRFDGGPRIVVLSGMQFPVKEEWLQKFREKFLPDVMLAMPGEGVPLLEGKNADKPTAHLCEDGTCQLPRDAFDVLKGLK